MRHPPGYLPQKPPTISMSFLPGNGTLSAGQAMVLGRLEELTGEYTRDLFPASDATSGGAIVDLPLYASDPDNPDKPLRTGYQAAEEILTNAPIMLPTQDYRAFKMIFSNAVNVSRMLLDPAVKDELALVEINKLCDEIETNAPAGIDNDLTRLRKLATGWPFDNTFHQLYKLSEKLRKNVPAIEPQLGAVLTYAYKRNKNSRDLRLLARKFALYAGDVIEKKTSDHLYQTQVQKDIYTRLFGDTRIGDIKGTLFISTQVIGDQEGARNDQFTFFRIENGILRPEPGPTVRTSENNHKLVDVVMATSAHQLAVPPYETEDGMACIDCAMVHSPIAGVLTALRVVQNEHRAARVELFNIFTGVDIIQTTGKEGMKHRMTKLNALGNMFYDQAQLTLFNGYVQSNAKTILREALGPDAITDFTIRLIPRTLKEQEELPERSALNTSPAQIRKARKAFQMNLYEQDEALRDIAQNLVDNMYSRGALTAEQYHEKIQRIWEMPKYPYEENLFAEDEQNIFDVVAKQEARRLSSRTSRTIIKFFNKCALSWGEKLMPAQIKPPEQVPPEQDINNVIVLPKPHRVDPAETALQPEQPPQQRHLG